MLFYKDTNNSENSTYPLQLFAIQSLLFLKITENTTFRYKSVYNGNLKESSSISAFSLNNTPVQSCYFRYIINRETLPKHSASTFQLFFRTSLSTTFRTALSQTFLLSFLLCRIKYVFPVTIYFQAIFIFIILLLSSRLSVPAHE